jgi:putative adhesin
MANLLAVALALVCVATVLDAQPSRFPVQQTDTVSRTMRVDESRGHLLEVSLVEGSIHLVGDDGNEIQAVARKTIEAATDADAVNADAVIGLDFAEGANALRIVGDAAHRSGCDADDDRPRANRRPPYRVRFDVDVRVPRGTRLRLCAINRGNIDVTGTTADFEIDNVNGAVTLTSVSGSGRADTVNGGVAASFTENPKAALQFKTVNGDIDVTFRRDLSADLRMKTFNGGLYTDFTVTQMPGVTPVVERVGGRVFYKADRYTMFRVGRGGPQLTFDTLNGDVRILGRD